MALFLFLSFFLALFTAFLFLSGFFFQTVVEARPTHDGGLSASLQKQCAYDLDEISSLMVSSLSGGDMFEVQWGHLDTVEMPKLHLDGAVLLSWGSPEGKRCQWERHLQERCNSDAYHFKLFKGDHGYELHFFVPKFHLPAHKAASTAEMGPGNWRDTVNNVWGDRNWQITMQTPFSLAVSACEAIKQWAVHKQAFYEFAVSEPKDVKEHLQKEDREAQNDGVKGLVHRNMSLSSFILHGIEIQDSACRHEENVSSMSAGAGMAERTKLVARGIAVHFTPGIAALRQSLTELSNDSDKSELAPWAIPLCLPSDPGANKLYDHRAKWYEFEYQITKAETVLHALHSALIYDTHMKRSKEEHASGTVVVTRSLQIMQDVKKQIDIQVKKYQHTRERLVLLWDDLKGAEDVEDHSDWMDGLEPLHDLDVEGPTSLDEELLGEGFKVLKWIWTVRGMGANVTEVAEAALCVEFCQSWAHAQCWQEECLLLTEEMRCTERYYISQVDGWEKHVRGWEAGAKAVPDPNLSESQQRAVTMSRVVVAGKVVHAWRQASVWRSLHGKAVDLHGDLVSKLQGSVEVAGGNNGQSGGKQQREALSACTHVMLISRPKHPFALELGHEKCILSASGLGASGITRRTSDLNMTVPKKLGPAGSDLELASLGDLGAWGMSVNVTENNKNASCSTSVAITRHNFNKTEYTVNHLPGFSDVYAVHMQAIWGIVLKRYVPLELDDPHWEIVEAVAGTVLYIWRSEIAKAVLHVIVGTLHLKLKEDINEGNALLAGQHGAKYLLGGVRFLYGNPDAKKGESACPFQSPLIVKTFYTHLRMTSQRLPAAQFPVGNPIGAVALCTVAVECALKLVHNGIISIDVWPPTARGTDTLDPASDDEEDGDADNDLRANICM
ncbi:hypothetical protein FA13DRAFT_1718652 [Coprinellus micaceus]|uniref:DUF6532 domain-containing protein n=1 Tax=Coprinellus micaceus TaxID=71717 RepID=A0A4Y7SCZ1_COPMI|nr:hypothetical protein FA13DRAFT_1718652 [Coprinellus micaceus]